MAFAIAHRSPLLLRPRLAQVCRRSPSRPHHLLARLAMPSTAAPALLDKASFTENWSVFVLRVPAKLCNGTRKVLKAHVLTMPRVLSVLRPTEAEQPPDAAPAMLLLLRYFATKPRSGFRAPPRGNGDDSLVDSSAAAVAGKLRDSQLPPRTPADVESFVSTASEKDILIKKVQVGYEQWSLDDVLKNVLPEGVTVPSSYEGVGHIAHLNLRDEHTNHKGLIGAAMLDKLGPRIKTVVNKLQSTGGPYRTFAMEVLAGDDNLETTLKENGCTFRLDFSKVYWNSRLETEHRRIINSLTPDDVLADAFCGIGPFAIPAAKQKKCRMIYANDLNPSSVEYLEKNAKQNRIDSDNFIASQSCAREFLRRLVAKERVPITKVLMNFPSGAPEFLDVFRGLYVGWTANPPMPTVHCYCFVKGLDDFNSARERARTSLMGENADPEEARTVLPDSSIDVRDIRDVAPRKRQVCVTFTVPKEVALAPTCDEILAEQNRPRKKAKTSV